MTASHAPLIHYTSQYTYVKYLRKVIILSYDWKISTYDRSFGAMNSGIPDIES